MAESFGFRATYFSRSLYRIQDQRPRSCHLFCDMIWRWEMVSIFHQWHNLSLTLTLQPEEISITCRPGGPGSTKMEMKKILFHKSEEKSPSAGDMVLWVSSRLLRREDKTLLCYSEAEASQKPSGSSYTRGINTVWPRRWNEKSLVPGFLAPDTTRGKGEEKW